MKVKIPEAVWEGKLSHQSNASFSVFVDMDNGDAVCCALSDNELINATLGNDEGDNDNENDVEKAQLCPTVAEASAAPSVLEDFRFFENAGCLSHLERWGKVVVSAHFTTLKQTKLISYCK